MRKSTLLLSVLGTTLTVMLAAAPANAQATRTWVSGVGDDVNPCSRTAPCKTFAGAISKTADGGEISVLDPGGFGAVTIGKGMTLNGDGTLAGILAASTFGVTVNAPAGKDVILRNLSINGVGDSATPGLTGVRFLGGGSLTLQNVNIYGFSQSCLDIAITVGGPITHVVESNFSNCVNGISVSNTAAGQRASVNVTRSTIGNVTNGVNGTRQASIVLEDVTIAGANVGASIASAGAAPASELNYNRGMNTQNQLGVQVGTGATARLNGVYFGINGKGLDNQGTCQSANNNFAGGNLAANTGAACVAANFF